MDEDNNVYLIFKNQDMTEGRGPMVFDSLWFDKEKAIKYMDKQPGVMGAKRAWSKEKVGGVWEIREVKPSD